MTSGERRVVAYLVQKLVGDDLLLYDVPIGSKQLYASRVQLILGFKDFRLQIIFQ